jgi:cell division control protein 6
MMGRSIIMDEGPLNETFLPQKTLHREEHVEEIINCLDPVKHGMPAKSLYIHGSTGVGKSAVIRSILQRNFPSHSAYVNCWNNKTTHKIMEQVLKGIGQMIHGKESTSELINRLESAKKRIIVCLDEADHLKDKDILYTFARNSCPVVLISNHPYSPAQMDNRIRSCLHLKEIEFRPYHPDEITSILKDRIETSLNVHAITDDLIAEIANSCSGDARAGIQILKNSAVDAESKGHLTITSDHVKAAAGYARKYRLSYLLGKLNDHQKTLYEILKQNKMMDSGSLFNEYKKITNSTVTDRCYRNYMIRMVELGLVREIGSSRWKKYEIAI